MEGIPTVLLLREAERTSKIRVILLLVSSTSKHRCCRIKLSAYISAKAAARDKPIHLVHNVKLFINLFSLYTGRKKQDKGQTEAHDQRERIEREKKQE